MGLSDNMSENEEKIPNGSLLVTIEGCGFCEEMKDTLSDQINNGEVAVLQCKINNKNNKNHEKCMEIINKPDFDGFPSIYDKEGNKIV